MACLWQANNSHDAGLHLEAGGAKADFFLTTNLTNSNPALTTSTTLMLSCFDLEVPLQSRMVSGVFWICSVPVVLNSQSLGGRGLVLGFGATLGQMHPNIGYNKDYNFFFAVYIWVSNYFWKRSFLLGRSFGCAGFRTIRDIARGLHSNVSGLGSR